MNTIAAQIVSSRVNRGFVSSLALGWLLTAVAILMPAEHPWLRLAGWVFAAARIGKQPEEGFLLLVYINLVARLSEQTASRPCA